MKLYVKYNKNAQFSLKNKYFDWILTIYIIVFMKDNIYWITTFLFGEIKAIF